MLIRLLVCMGMASARLLELVHSRRNVARSGPTIEGPWSRATYPLVIAIHAATIGGTLIRGRRASPLWLALLLAVQPLRLWVLVTLGRRWNTRAAVPTEMRVETGGPYAYVRHPNYVVVALELFALPMAFGLTKLALFSTLANAILLGPRIGEEESALKRLPGYRRHFGSKKRFIPGLF